MKRLFFYFGAICALLCLLFPLGSCDKTVDYVEYVSEYRSEIYLAESENYSLTVFFSEREYPYAADGLCANKQDLIEIYLTTPDNTKNYDLSFTAADGKECGGDMSYDSVYGRFFYSQSLPAMTSPSIAFKLTYDETTVTLEAKRVKTGEELTMPEIIGKTIEQKQTLFDGMTKGNSFTGEIGVRLVYNEKCYYYVGVTNAAGLTDCFLLDAYTGNILAERPHG